ncbi:Smr/MutS family protein [Nitratidesulfovibrio sp. SRB-5]|uniref:Smr/MutS family protein n=1 Tax=Nitratidesulfovibrio sp. SRB-5 TaxID=2872636 RepID=UPI0010264454|nr:Smr/MutS family protein [Nitratidesulfovibrio sp. SRB-5]MBZ2171338.1 Smr/MutS family protein [Nitratidesulfovibrio sp. SRB-5]RXF76863.1 DNA mismatch repair protein MutS [Desulfovibrio sp. DS-1]
MADTPDDDFDSANPFRSLNKRAFRDARAPKSAVRPAPSAPKPGTRPGGSQKLPDEPLSSEDAEAFMSAMGTVQRLDAPKKPGKGTPQGHANQKPAPASVTPEMPASPPVPNVSSSPRPGGGQSTRPAAPASAMRAAERDKLAPNTAARLDADASRNGFSLQDQPGFRRLLEHAEGTPVAENAPAAPPSASSIMTGMTGVTGATGSAGAAPPGKPHAVPVTASERKEAVRQRSRQAVTDHDHTPPPDEDNLFTKAMSGVRTLAGKGREVPPETAPREAAAPAVGHPLQDFMDGTVEFALEFTDEYLEGHVVGLDALTVGKLRAGQYSPEGHLDLHGMNALQAYEAMIGFMRAAYHKGMRTVLVIPGRGKNSPDGMGVLREKVQAWLTHDPFKRVVLAFCTAQPTHGGAGALYVLLRKYKKSRGKIQWDRTPTDADLFL